MDTMIDDLKKPLHRKLMNLILRGGMGCYALIEGDFCYFIYVYFSGVCQQNKGAPQQRRGSPNIGRGY